MKIPHKNSCINFNKFMKNFEKLLKKSPKKIIKNYFLSKLKKKNQKIHQKFLKKTIKNYWKKPSIIIEKNHQK